MKTFKYFLATLAFVSLFACSNDDDNPGVEAAAVVGEWNLDEYNYTSSTTVTQGENSYSTVGVGEAINLDAQMILNNDNTYQTEGSYTIKLFTTYNGETSQSNSNYYLDGTGTYRIEGNKIILGDQQQTGMDESISFSEATIVELTANRMVWSLDDTVTTEMEGMSVSISVEAILVLSR